MQNTEKKTEKRPSRRYLRYLLFIYLLSLVAILVFYRVSPKYYRATVSILKPSEIFHGIAGEGYDALETRALQSGAESEILFAILQSRALKERVVEEFDLVNVYNARSMQGAIKRLAGLTRISLPNGGIINISVLDTGPGRAAEMANFYTEQLSDIFSDILYSDRGRGRELIEERLEKSENRIRELEEEIYLARGDNIFFADRELREISRVGGNLMQQAVDKQIQMERAVRSFGEGSPEYLMLRHELDDIQAAISVVSNLERELADVVRELKVQEEIYFALASALEEDRIEQARQTGIVRVLDRASVPDQIYRPDIKGMLLVHFLIGAILAIILFFFDLLRYLGSI